jgi:hypothetical protein
VKINKKIDEMIAELEGAKEEVLKFKKKKNRAAGTRVRKVMQDTKNTAQDIRVEIMRIQKEDW